MELNSWTALVATSSDLSDGVPLFFLLRGRSLNLRILTVYFSISLIIKLVTIILIKTLDHPNTLPFYHFLAPFEFVCLGIYYKNAVPIKPQIAMTLLIAVVAFNFFDSLILQPLVEFNSYSWSLNTFLLMCLAFVYLYAFYVRGEDISVEKHSGFIINTGFLIYFSGSLFTYLLGWYILSQEREGGLFANGWIVQSISNICKNLILAYGISLVRNK